MTIAVTRLDFIVYASRMSSVYAHAFDNVQQILDRYEITDKPLRLAHFIAQVMAESEALNRCTEDLCYSAERIVKEWPLHFQPHTRNDPADFAGKPEALADVVYGGRMGNTAPGDGFAYRGRGLLQLTGKDGYRHVTGLLREGVPRRPRSDGRPGPGVRAGLEPEHRRGVLERQRRQPGRRQRLHRRGDTRGQRGNGRAGGPPPLVRKGRRAPPAVLDPRQEAAGRLSVQASGRVRSWHHRSHHRSHQRAVRRTIRRPGRSTATMPA